MTTPESHQQCERCTMILRELDAAPVCPRCAGLLELVHPPLSENAGSLKKRFAERRMALEGPDASGVWRYRELVLPSATVEP
jgi:hypothetical protein